MDVGKDVRRSSGKANVLAEKVARTDFMNGWLLDNQENFKETMELIREHAPVKWAELYMKGYQMGLIKETNFNININRQQDREDLQALVRTRIPQKGSYTPYEEIKPQQIEKKEEGL